MEFDNKDERHQDRLIYFLLNSTVKILTHVNVFDSPKQRELVSQLLDYCEAFLLHPHSWVRTASAQIFGLLFAQYQPKAIASSLGENTNWLSRGGRELLDKLILNFLEQFQSRQVPLDLLDQLTKNLLFVAKVIAGARESNIGTKYCLDFWSRLECKGLTTGDEFQVLLYLEILNIPDGGTDKSEAEESQLNHRTFSWFVYKIEKELRNLGSERSLNLEKVNERNMIPRFPSGLSE